MRAHKAWCFFVQINSKTLKTINAKFFSFPNRYSLLNATIKKLFKKRIKNNQKFRRVVNSLKAWKPIKECFDFQARSPKSSRPQAFARFAQWLIRCCLWSNVTFNTPTNECWRFTLKPQIRYTKGHIQNFLVRDNQNTLYLCFFLKNVFTGDLYINLYDIEIKAHA